MSEKGFCVWATAARRGVGPVRCFVGLAQLRQLRKKNAIFRIFRLVFCRKTFGDGAGVSGWLSEGDVVKTFHLGSL